MIKLSTEERFCQLQNSGRGIKIKLMKFVIPKEVVSIAQTLEKAGYQAYLVGGCVRDLLLGAVYGEPVEPKDWDVATDARPEETQKFFTDSVYENQFGTVAVKTQSDVNGSADAKALADRQMSDVRIVEVTTFRIEGKYTDKRHPDEIKFTDTIEEDLSRRDFTINSMALNMGQLSDTVPRTERLSGARVRGPAGAEALAGRQMSGLVDPYGGQKDLKNKIVRAVVTRGSVSVRTPCGLCAPCG